ncbi:MAG: hypothetical protein OER86_04760, partial [Phycisphaerae bacterium]|nr:hypothetical protein [Phycisphaerae bacterium]
SCVDMNFGLQGFRLGIESLQALVDGGVAVATPQRPGGRVSTGHMFKLAARAEEEWLGWRPQLAVGGKLLPPGGTPPRMLRVTVARVVGRVFSSQVQEKGWVLATGSDVIGPKSLLAPKRQKNDQATLQVAGKRISLDQLTVRSVGELVQVKLSLDAPAPAEPPRRSMSQVEDCVVWTTSGSGTLPLDAARLLPSGDNAFLVERSVAFDQTLQGAAVLARRDGALVGILLVEKGSGRIVALPPRTGP